MPGLSSIAAESLRHFERRRVGGAELLVNAELSPPYADAALAAPETLAEAPGDARASGRGALRAIEAGGGARLLVRHYRRGGLLGPVLGDRYLRCGPSRPEAELIVTEYLRARGVRVPRIAAALVRPAGPCAYRGDLFVLEEPGARDFAAFLRSAPPAREKREALRSAAREARRLHDAGVVHPDLNVKNLLLTASGEAMILDFDRASVPEPGRPLPPAPRARALLRLLRSAAKLGLAPGAVGRAEVVAFLRAYAAGDRAALSGLRREAARHALALPLRRLLWRRAA